MAFACWVEAGGIAGLHGLLSEHGEAIEADLRHYYQRRLRDLATGEMTWREFRCYLNELPDECRLARSVAGEIAGWGPQERILADIYDVLADANWQRGGNKNQTRPKPYPRPVDKRAVEALGRRLRKLKRGSSD